MPAPSQPELYRPKLTYPDIPYGAMLDRPAQLYPEREAIVFKDVNVTFRDMKAHADQHAGSDVDSLRARFGCERKHNHA